MNDGFKIFSVEARKQTVREFEAQRGPMVTKTVWKDGHEREYRCCPIGVVMLNHGMLVPFVQAGKPKPHDILLLSIVDLSGTPRCPAKPNYFDIVDIFVASNPEIDSKDADLIAHKLTNFYDEWDHGYKAYLNIRSEMTEAEEWV